MQVMTINCEFSLASKALFWRLWLWNRFWCFFNVLRIIMWECPCHPYNIIRMESTNSMVLTYRRCGCLANYHIAGHFDRELNSENFWWGINLVVWHSTFKYGGLEIYLCNSHIKSTNISYFIINVWWSPANSNLPTFLQWRFGVQLPN